MFRRYEISKLYFLKGRIITIHLYLLILFLLNCTLAPVAYQEDLPAYSPDWGFPKIRIGIHQQYWHRDAKWSADRYGDIGIRTGQRLNIFSFEQGLASYSFNNKLMVGLQAGIGMKNGLIMIRGVWFSLNIYYYTDLVRVEFSPKNPWWQISLFTGTKYLPKGFGWSLGDRASNYAIGLVLGAELGEDIMSFRAEASATFKSFWAPDRVKG